MILTLKNKNHEVATFEQASSIYNGARDKSGQGASRFPNGQIFDAAGNQTHYISYNGKVWLGAEYIIGGTNTVIFDPYQ